MTDIKINDTNVVRVEVSEFKGKKNLNIRIWYLDKEENWKPTQKGVTLPVEKYKELKDAIDALGKELK